MPHDLMYDSVSVTAIPAGAEMVAGYVDGNYRNVDEMARRFPEARIVTIATMVASAADVLDVERGDATPQEAPGWVRRMRSARRRPIVYCSRGAWPEVIGSFASQRVAPPFYWIADWTGLPHDLPGAIAVQYASPTVPAPNQTGNYDTSLVAPGFPERYRPTSTGGTTVKLLTDRQRLSSLLRQGLAIIGVVIGLGNQLHLPPGIRAVLVAASGLLLTVEHYVGDTTTGSPKPPVA